MKVNDHHMLLNSSTHWIGVGIHAGEDMLGVTQDFMQIFKVKYCGVFNVAIIILTQQSNNHFFKLAN